MERAILEKLKKRDSLDELSKEVVDNWENLDAEFKLNFLFTLRRENMRDFAESISRILSMEQNERIQATMVKIFHQLGVDTSGTFFLQCIHSIDPRVRANALEAIGNKYTEKYEDVVFAFLDDMDNRVRANAIKILWASGDLKVKLALKRMIFDPDLWMRISGLYVIQSMRLSEFTPEVIKLFEDNVDTVREWAYKSVSFILNSHNSDKLRSAVQGRYYLEENHFLRNEIINALIELRGGDDFLKDVLIKEKKSYIKGVVLKGFYRNKIPLSLEFCYNIYNKENTDEMIKGELIKLLEICRESRKERLDFLQKVFCDDASHYLKKLSASVLGRFCNEEEFAEFEFAGNDDNKEYIELIYKGFDSRL